MCPCIIRSVNKEVLCHRVPGADSNLRVDPRSWKTFSRSNRRLKKKKPTVHIEKNPKGSGASGRPRWFRYLPRYLLAQAARWKG